MFLLVLHLLISQVLDDISQIQWTHTKHQPSNPVVTPIFSPNNEEDGEFNSCLSEKTTQRLPQNPDELAFRDFSPWHRYRFVWTAICIYMCFFHIQKSSKIQSTLEGEVTIATYALSKSLLITKVFLCCPIQSSSSPGVIRWVGIPSQDAGSWRRFRLNSWDPPNLKHIMSSS